LQFGGARFEVWFFKGRGFLRDVGLSPQKTRGVPGKGNRDAEGTRHKAGRRSALQSLVKVAQRAEGRLLKRSKAFFRG
jgi:hypothetical protein